MNIKIVVAMCLSVLSMHYLSTADSRNDILEKRLLAYSQQYKEIKRDANVADSGECYNRLLKDAEEKNIRLDRVFVILKDTEDTSPHQLYCAYNNRKTNAKNDKDEERKTIIELLRAAEFLGIERLKDFCRDDLVERYEKLDLLTRFQSDPQLFEQEADLEPSLQNLIVERLWRSIKDFQKACIKAELKVPDCCVKSITYSPNGLHIVSGHDNGTLTIWDVETGNQIEKLHGDDDNFVSSVAYSPDGLRLVSGYDDGRLIIWDVKTGQIKQRKSVGHAIRSVSCEYSPSGKLWICAETLRGTWTSMRTRWNVTDDTLARLPSFGEDSYTPYRIAYSPDGLHIARQNLDDSAILIQTVSNFEGVPPKVSIPHVLYIHGQLKNLQGQSSALTEVSLKDKEKEKENEQAQSSLYTSMTNYITASLISFLGVNQAGETVVSLIEQKERAQREYQKDAQREYRLGQIHESLPDEMKELLDYWSKQPT